MRRRTTALPVLIAGAMLVAACSSGGSIQNAGNTTPPTPTTVPAAATTTAAPADTLAPGETLAPGVTAAPVVTDASTTVAPATTVATPLDDLPTCNTTALADVTSPVEITFWHGLTANNETALQALTDTYNSSQTKVHVTLQNQGGYEQSIDKYLQSGQDDRPDIIQAPEYAVQVFRDTKSFIPVDACIQADSYDTSPILPATINAYSTGGVQWAMPFNVSNPVLYYNKAMFRAAGLDPDQPPRSLEELEADSKAIVASGVAKYGLVMDTDFDSGGGWYIEQWFAKAQQFYADNNNGRSAPATKVFFDNQTGIDLYTFLQNLQTSGEGFNVGDNTSGQDALLKLADASEPGAMTISTSAALGTVLAAIGAIAPNIASSDIGVGPMPGPNGSSTVLVGGNAVWIVGDKGDQKTAATWDFVKYLASAQAQSTIAAATGYVPMRTDATLLEPLKTTYTTDPRFAVAYQSLYDTPADDPTAVDPLLGPQREIRVLTARALSAVFGGADVASTLADAATQADALLADYASRNP